MISEIRKNIDFIFYLGVALIVTHYILKMTGKPQGLAGTGS